MCYSSANKYPSFCHLLTYELTNSLLHYSFINMILFIHWRYFVWLLIFVSTDNLYTYFLQTKNKIIAVVSIKNAISTLWDYSLRLVHDPICCLSSFKKRIDKITSHILKIWCYLFTPFLVLVNCLKCHFWLSRLKINNYV